jgi:threonine aldolase|tara:strand:- start:32202 stop:33257 length:1056 start_codon:yes stop_codon:yes gene_type:complete
MTHYVGMKSTNGQSGFIDFRSDTVTKPSSEMKQAAMDCVLGDDVYGEDPTVNELEEKMATLLEKEAALFLPTGSMSNLVSLLAHCGRGEEILVGDKYHIYRDEANGASVLGGIAMDPLKTDVFGALDIHDIIKAIKPNDSHCSITKLLCLENTVAGCVQNQKDIDIIATTAKKSDLAIHLDGARLFNAAVAQEVSISTLVKNVDTVSICLSKGLGAPAGSVMVGPKKLVNYARRQRKLLGGGMRQIGIIAACCLYGIEHNVKQLKHDHIKTKRLSSELSKISQLGINLDMVQTNMMFIHPDRDEAEALSTFLYERKILIGGQNSPRMVVHLDISEDDIESTISAFNEFYQK